MKTLIILSRLLLSTFYSFNISSFDTKNEDLLFSEKAEESRVRSLKITTLSTMLANSGIGEWGYSALVEVDGKKILFDTGINALYIIKNLLAHDREHAVVGSVGDSYDLENGIRATTIAK